MTAEAFPDAKILLYPEDLSHGQDDDGVRVISSIPLIPPRS